MHFARTWAAAALLAVATAAQAGPVVTTNFNAGSTGWTLASGVAALGTAGANDGAITGKDLSFTGNSDAAATYALGSTISASKVLVQFDLQFDAGQIDGNDFLGLWLGSSTGPNVGLKGNCGGTAGCTSDLFVRTTGVDGSFTTAITVGTTYHLFALLEKTGGSVNYNRYSLWVDPTSAEMSSFTGADAVFTGNSGIGKFDTLGFRTANLDAGDVVLVDNLNVSTVPEPGSLALVSLALAGVGFAARRRAR